MILAEHGGKFGGINFGFNTQVGARAPIRTRYNLGVVDLRHLTNFFLEGHLADELINLFFDGFIRTAFKTSSVGKGGYVTRTATVWALVGIASRKKDNGYGRRHSDSCQAYHV